MITCSENSAQGRLELPVGMARLCLLWQWEVHSVHLSTAGAKKQKEIWSSINTNTNPEERQIHSPCLQLRLPTLITFCFIAALWFFFLITKIYFQSLCLHIYIIVRQLKLVEVRITHKYVSKIFEIIFFSQKIIFFFLYFKKRWVKITIKRMERKLRVGNHTWDTYIWQRLILFRIEYEKF